mmetsp:Transcript_161/g.496  ORF Transcript_161/g.496 Transcript_161/m.496 type:complete len:266 (+) Transcript_161:243-1040(+)
MAAELLGVRHASRGRAPRCLWRRKLTGQEQPWPRLCSATRGSSGWNAARESGMLGRWQAYTCGTAQRSSHGWTASKTTGPAKLAWCLEHRHSGMWYFCRGTLQHRASQASLFIQLETRAVIWILLVVSLGSCPRHLRALPRCSARWQRPMGLRRLGSWPSLTSPSRPRTTGPSSACPRSSRRSAPRRGSGPAPTRAAAGPRPSGRSSPRRRGRRSARSSSSAAATTCRRQARPRCTTGSVWATCCPPTSSLAPRPRWHATWSGRR